MRARMPLAFGAKLGPCRIQAPLGAGGRARCMGPGTSGQTESNRLSGNSVCLPGIATPVLKRVFFLKKVTISS
jgi:hypothetical protein